MNHRKASLAITNHPSATIHHQPSTTNPHEPPLDYPIAVALRLENAAVLRPLSQEGRSLANEMVPLSNEA